ncbi:MAG: hypothetical protein DRJ56_00325 [Thermoprotei archaeon]|nr:MAG: hypothetical protein DRJ43_05430 [Thermoprotei archaeon]RLE78345.1 MAG: hypothetical protein DRJ56_00325 [Thermoprotei archaeon]
MSSLAWDTLAALSVAALTLYLVACIDLTSPVRASAKGLRAVKSIVDVVREELQGGSLERAAELLERGRVAEARGELSKLLAPLAPRGVVGLRVTSLSGETLLLVGREGAILARVLVVARRTPYVVEVLVRGRG